jgi:hypothetical protein
VTCPDPVPGSVTNASGSVDGTPLTDLVDAYGQKQGATFQWQYFATLSTKPSVCAHYRGNQTVQDERWLIVTLIGSRDPMDYGICPYPQVPITVGVGPGKTPVYDGQGNLYTAHASYAAHNTRCAQSGRDVTGGSLTFTAVTDTLLEGSYALDFTSDHVEGSFSAPYCVLCATRPSKTTCVTG